LTSFVACGDDPEDAPSDTADTSEADATDVAADTIDVDAADSDTPGQDVPTTDVRPDGGSGAGLVWFSDWRNGTGSERAALYDGDKWTDQLCNAPVAEVVAATGLDFPTDNVYRSHYDTPGNCLMVQVTGAWDPPAPGEYMFVRAYYRNAMPDGAEV